MDYRLLGFGITLIIAINHVIMADFLGSRSQFQRNKKYYLTMLTPPQIILYIFFEIMYFI